MSRLTILFLVLISVKCTAQLKAIPSGPYYWADIPVVKSTDREGRRFLEGTTSELSYFEIHASTQLKGAAARPPHAQTDIEELVFVKEGTMKFTLGTQSRILGKGSVVLVPPHEMQAIENVGNNSLTYYVIMFRAKKPADMARSARAGGPLMLNADSLKYTLSAQGGVIRYLERPSAMFDNLELHITELKTKGTSYDQHTNADTELILMLEGETAISVNNKIFQAVVGDICLMNSNEPHGVSNSKDAPCKYLVVKWR